MTCAGCSGAVTRILNKIDGVENVECDLTNEDVAQRTVKVTHTEAVTVKAMNDSLQKLSQVSDSALTTLCTKLT